MRIHFGGTSWEARKEAARALVQQMMAEDAAKNQQEHETREVEMRAFVDLLKGTNCVVKTTCLEVIL